MGWPLDYVHLIFLALVLYNTSYAVRNLVFIFNFTWKFENTDTILYNRKFYYKVNVKFKDFTTY